MTHLRQMMLDELQRRNYAQSTAEAYIHALKDFAAYYHRPPDRLGPKEISHFQLHLLRDRKLSPQTVKQHMAAVRFFFVHTLKRHYPPSEFRYPKTPQRLPVILSQDEVRRMIDAATNLLHRTMLMTLYSTGMRRAELTRLKVGDIDSQRMVIHIKQGKGGKDRDVPLSPKLLETLREYWRWKKPQEYLFPGEAKSGSKGEHLTSKAVYHACQRGCTQSRHPEEGRTAYAAAFLCHSSSGIRSRPAHDSAVARTRQPESHDDLSAFVPASSSRLSESAG